MTALTSCDGGRTVLSMIESEVVDRDWAIDHVLRHGSASQIINMASQFDVDVAEAQEAVLDRGNPAEVVRFAATIPGADIDIIEKHIIALDSPTWASRMILDVDGVDVNTLMRIAVRDTDSTAQSAKDRRVALKIRFGDILSEVRGELEQEDQYVSPWDSE